MIESLASIYGILFGIFATLQAILLAILFPGFMRVVTIVGWVCGAVLLFVAFVQIKNSSYAPHTTGSAPIYRK